MDPNMQIGHRVADQVITGQASAPAGGAHATKSAGEMKETAPVTGSQVGKSEKGLLARGAGFVWSGVTGAGSLLARGVGAVAEAASFVAHAIADGFKNAFSSAKRSKFEITDEEEALIEQIGNTFPPGIVTAIGFTIGNCQHILNGTPGIFYRETEYSKMTPAQLQEALKEAIQNLKNLKATNTISEGDYSIKIPPELISIITPIIDRLIREMKARLTS